MFAFLDPRWQQVEWSTVQTLSDSRRDKKTKVEQWILMPEPAIARVVGLRGAQGRRSVKRLWRLPSRWSRIGASRNSYVTLW